LIRISSAKLPCASSSLYGFCSVLASCAISLPGGISPVYPKLICANPVIPGFTSRIRSSKNGIA
jgi:hypothetical protein